MSGRRPPDDEPTARAARGEGLRTVFQPIVDLRRLRVAGYEALSRFDGRGAPGPEAVLAHAEANGALGELEARCLGSALAQRDRLPANCFLTVNIEPRALSTPPVEAVLGDAGDLRGVVIEVTERHQLDDPPSFRRTLDRWREAGARVAIDDAGAGHSGLQRLLAVRPEIVKLDGALVRGVDHDEAKAALVEMLGAFANRIDAWLLAEGVETRAEAQRLTSLDVPLAQGRYLGAAGPPWEPLRPSACDELRAVRAAARGGLLGLVQTARQVRTGAEHEVPPEAFLASPGHVVVVDEHGGPVGTLDRPVAAGGDVELQRSLRVNVHTEVADLAHRISTREPVDTSTPVVVTDDAGRALGIVTVPRLLRALAGEC